MLIHRIMQVSDDCPSGRWSLNLNDSNALCCGLRGETWHDANPQAGGDKRDSAVVVGRLNYRRRREPCCVPRHRGNDGAWAFCDVIPYPFLVLQLAEPDRWPIRESVRRRKDCYIRVSRDFDAGVPMRDWCLLAGYFHAQIDVRAGSRRRDVAEDNIDRGVGVFAGQFCEYLRQESLTGGGKGAEHERRTSPFIQ